MDEKSAQELLSAVREQSEKQAEGWRDTVSGYAGDAVKAIGDLGQAVSSSSWVSGLNPEQQQQVAQLRAAAPRELARKRQKNVVNALMLALGGGAALRGGLGLSRMMSDTSPVASRTVDMPLAYPVEEEEDEKRAGDAAHTPLDAVYDAVGMGPAADPQHTEVSGVTGYYPSLLLGTPLAAYAGWKGIDALLNSQRKAKTKDKLDKAKERYEQAVRESYKTASADPLDQAFDSLEKAANGGSMFNPSTWFPNLSGQAKGLLATYALLSGPAAYMYVDDKMKKTSKKSILEKAMKERARRQARAQPAELYAIPQPEPERDEEKEKDDFLEGIV